MIHEMNEYFIWLDDNQNININDENRRNGDVTTFIGLTLLLASFTGSLLSPSFDTTASRPSPPHTLPSHTKLETNYKFELPF